MARAEAPLAVAAGDTWRLRSNLLVLAAVTATGAVQLALVYVAPLQRLFDTQALSLPQLAVILTASTVALAAVGIEKLIRRRTDR
jgi:P-type Ca2+ transporter type 2C